MCLDCIRWSRARIKQQNKNNMEKCFVERANERMSERKKNNILPDTSNKLYPTPEHTGERAHTHIYLRQHACIAYAANERKLTHSTVPLGLCFFLGFDISAAAAAAAAARRCVVVFFSLFLSIVVFFFIHFVSNYFRSVLHSKSSIFHTLHAIRTAHEQRTPSTHTHVRSHQDSR